MTETQRVATVVKIILIFVFLSVPARTVALEKTFSGFYGGPALERQTIVGGSLVSGIDVLSQDTRTVFSLLVGGRYQLDPGLVIGAEVSLGFMNGDLHLADPASQLDVSYKNSQQTTYGLNIGYALGSGQQWLIFGYVSEATRTFDITIQQGTTASAQKDEQGMLRFGLGGETQILEHVHLRLSAGTQRADFGDKRTNIDVKKTFEFAAAVIFQL